MVDVEEIKVNKKNLFNGAVNQNRRTPPNFECGYDHENAYQ